MILGSILYKLGIYSQEKKAGNATTNFDIYILGFSSSSLFLSLFPFTLQTLKFPNFGLSSENICDECFRFWPFRHKKASFNYLAENDLQTEGFLVSQQK